MPDVHCLHALTAHYRRPQLDPALIDLAVWPDTPGTRDCDFVASYGPGGSNDSRALLLRGGARAWPITDSLSLGRLIYKYPEIV